MNFLIIFLFFLTIFSFFIDRETRRKYMKKGLWNEKELKLLLWSVVFYSEHISQKIDEFVILNLDLSNEF